MSFIAANSIWSTVYLLFLTRQLGLEPWQVGVLFAAGGPGALLGSLSAGRIVARLGLGRPIIATQLAASVAMLLIPLAAAVPSAMAIVFLVGGAFVSGAMITVGNVCELTLRQSVTPDRLQGRMNATMRSLNWSTAAVGALLGGVLGDALGLVPTLVIGVTCSRLSSGWLIFSPLRFGPRSLLGQNSDDD